MTNLYLSAASLCSKWGFNDGEVPEEVLDRCDDLRIPYEDIDWHAVLRRLVREHLVPALAAHHKIEVYDVETSHNPIRASLIDGRKVDDFNDDPDAWAEYLSHTRVDVPMDVVIAAIREAQ